MANETVPASDAGVTVLTKERVEAICSATMELQMLTVALLPFVEKYDSGGEVYPVVRGALLRVSNLSDAIYSTVNFSEEDSDIRSVRRAIYGTPEARNDD